MGLIAWRRGDAAPVCLYTDGGVVLSTLDRADLHKENLLAANRLAVGIDNRRRLLWHLNVGAVRGIIHLLTIR